MFRASNRVLLRKLCENSIFHKRWIAVWAPCNQPQKVVPGYSSLWFKGSYANQFPPLVNSLPGIRLPPCLPHYLERFPTRITKLSNGLKIASEDSPGPAACVGLFVDSGSIYEGEKSQGVTHLLERMSFKSTKNRNHCRIMHDIEATGANVGASASREQMAYSYDTIKTFLPEAVELLVDCIRNPLFLDSELKEQVAKGKAEIEAMSSNPQQFLLESLHLTGYSEPLLNDLRSGYPKVVPKTDYVGGDFRHRVNSEKTHVSLAFEVPGGWHQDKDATALTVLQALMGGGGSFSSGGPGKGMHSRLYLRVLNKYPEVETFSAFSSVYNDSGLFGIHLTTESDFVEKAVEVAIDELIAVATPGQVTELELQRAKNSIKSAILINLESRTIVTEDIGRQILTYGCRKPVEHFLIAVDELTLSDLGRLVHKILSSPLTMGSWGDVDRVPSYASVSKHFHAAN
ncbi:mitochondrial-processing peptidase subunit alpha-like isoform X2 [Macadamia integrifolia]|uniref:mitochondrial-processing peptidase subunit alpha-like isoform X2 n=1 Tax=Macadamia integrifolia TaxID=60698 RepID=UPI001C4FF986|nr:mitochondrial-processing peptidase subunit alpha-like isoform X2 [Macadamia integrifolia]